jgi:hypothetical protein
LDRDKQRSWCSQDVVGARAAIFFWATTKADDSAVISHWTLWCADCDDDWGSKAAVIENAHCGGPIAKSTLVLILAPHEVISSLGGFDDKDGMEPMEGYLDLPNTMYSNYLQGWTLEATESAEKDEYSPRVITKIDHWGTTLVVFGTDLVAPSLNAAKREDGDIHFVITTSDMGLKQSVRPVRDHKLFALYGFPPEFTRTVVNLP